MVRGRSVARGSAARGSCVRSKAKNSSANSTPTRGCARVGVSFRTTKFQGPQQVPEQAGAIETRSVRSCWFQSTEWGTSTKGCAQRAVGSALASPTQWPEPSQFTARVTRPRQLAPVRAAVGQVNGEVPVLVVALTGDGGAERAPARGLHPRGRWHRPRPTTSGPGHHLDAKGAGLAPGDTLTLAVHGQRHALDGDSPEGHHRAFVLAVTMAVPVVMSVVMTMVFFSVRALVMVVILGSLLRMVVTLSAVIVVRAGRIGARIRFFGRRGRSSGNLQGRLR